MGGVTLWIGPPPSDEAYASVLRLARAPLIGRALLMGGASAHTYLFASAKGCCQRLGFYAGEGRLLHFNQKSLRAGTWYHRRIWALMSVSSIPTFFVLSWAQVV